MPPALPGEGAFGASGTNVAVIEANVWIATTASRWWLTIGPTGANGSTDDGQSWIPVEMAPAAGFDAFSFAPGTGVGWAIGSGGRISRLTVSPR